MLCVMEDRMRIKLLSLFCGAALGLIESGWDCGLDEEGVKANFALITSD